MSAMNRCHDLDPRNHRRYARRFRFAGRLGAVAVLVSAGLTWTGCTETLLGPKADQAVAVIHPTTGNAISGTVTFTRESGRVRIVARVSGLSPGDHGFHIHEFGDCSGGDGKTAGGHFNPTGSNHGGPEAAERHVGDLGNITANANGNATMNRLDAVVTLQGDNSILGRGVIVHAGADDFTTQPTGAAGARLGCGVIGVHNASG
jgi:Cu-Zn family superoxide dismutase